MRTENMSMKPVHSRPRRARAKKGLPVQRGGWIAPDVLKPTGYDMVLWLQRRTQRGGWIVTRPSYDAKREIKRYKKRRTTRSRRTRR